MDDSMIVNLYLARNERALEQTQAKYGRRLTSLSEGITGNRSDAEECVNDTYLAAWNSIPPHKPQDYLYTYLARITRQRSLDCLKMKNRKKRSAYILELSSEIEECIPAPDDECRLGESELCALIDNFLRGLKYEARVIFVRRYWHLDTVAGIAGLLGVSVGKVKSSLFRTRGGLYEYLKKQGVEL